MQEIVCMDREYDVLGGYLPSFVQHLKDTSARLGLRIGSLANEVQDNEDASWTCADSSGWTPAEQDAFFRAVSVYSRWRPDLVAACIPTKTEWEVWMYLEALEEGAAALTVDVNMEDALGVESSSGAGSRLDSDTDGDGDTHDRPDVEMHAEASSGLRPRSHSDSGTDEDEDEGVCEPALEVSQAWIDAEEHMASWIVREEHLASINDGDIATDGASEDKPQKRKRGRPRVGERKHAQSQAPGRTVSNGSPPDPRGSASPELASTSARKLSRDSDTALERKRQALMSRLEVSHLMVLDGILREGEEATRKSRESSVTRATHGDESAPHVSLSDRITQGTDNISGSSSNAVIDPVLLALSGGADPEECSEGSASAHAPAQGPEFTFPLDDATRANPDPAANAESDLSLFSPRTRRRIQKRLYMRRKRASLQDGGGAVDTGIEKLKPGKKAKPELREPSTSVPCSVTPSDDEVEAPKKNKPGLTLPYKLKAQFAELGIDAACLCDRGMDLLNLGALGRLMGLYASLEHEEDEDFAESIDAELIRRLQAAMVSFVTDVIHRAIVWKEREMRLKQRSRAWRHGEQITSSAVEHAVEVIGARHHSHKAYFKSLEALRGRLSDTSRSPLHRDVYTPIVHAPSAWQIGPLASLARTYEREATRTRRGTSAEVEEELMSDETDEEALEAEMSAEAAVDEADVALAETEEHTLWQRID